MIELADHLDPRIKRTRHLLVQAFQSLLTTKTFESISVQDIAECATVNRATFYDHFTDKFALLDYMIGDSFQLLLEGRNVAQASACPESLKRLILAVCDFVAQIDSRCKSQQRQFEPLVEWKIKSLVRDLLLSSLKAHGHPSPELAATMTSWSIYGAAIEWKTYRSHQTPEAFTEIVLPMISASLQVSCPGPA